MMRGLWTIARTAGVGGGALLALACAALYCAAADPPASDLSPAQKKQAATLAADFRKSKSHDQRLLLIEKAAELAPAAVQAIFDQVNQELHRDLALYRTHYVKAAAVVVSKRAAAGSIAEIAELRARLAALRSDPALTSEMIKRDGDPALLRLKTLILVPREDVLAQDARLGERRKALANLGAQWEACAVRLEAAEEKRDDRQPLPRFDAYLQQEEEVAAGLALPMDPKVRQVLASNAALAAKLDPEEARCIAELNLMRNLMGLTPVAIDPALVLCARDHSSDMQTKKFFSHTSPIMGKESFAQRAALFKTSASGENIAAGANDGGSVNRMWWYSPGHMQNMLGDHRRVGVGRAGRLWTELFGS